MVSTVFQLNEQIIDLLDMAVPTMDMMHSLQHSSDWFWHDNGDAYTRDVRDDAHHLSSRLFEMVNALIRLHCADVEKQLTMVATIFLLLTLFSSRFGQNLAFMAEHRKGSAEFPRRPVDGPGVPLT